MAQNYRQVGNTITDFVASEVVCPAARSGLPQAGDVCVAGQLTGISESSTAVAGDTVVLQLKGVYSVPAVANNGGASKISKGDLLYVDPSTAIVSKISTGLFFGYALSEVTSGTTANCNVRLGVLSALGYSTGATAGDTNPVMDGVAAAGVSAAYSRKDHVHPSDTSRAADNAVVKLTGNQTVAGVKTFSSMPLFPLPGPYANDAAAQAGGVAVGSPYYVTTTGNVQVRMA